MYEIKLMNTETGEIFSKFYYSYYVWKKAINKMKYSKKVKILSYREN